MSAGLLLAALRHARAIAVGGPAVVVLLAWIYLARAAASAGEMVMRPEWTLGYGLVMFVMWATMMVAMMLPSAAPVTLLMVGIARRRASACGAAGASATLFVCGYLVVWFAFAAAATFLQWGLDTAGMLSPAMAFGEVVLAGSVLIAAGLYQLSPLKRACLHHCRSPLDFLLQRRDGAAGAVAIGIGHGLFCLGCCWMLMALLFVGGIMNLAWMADIALLVLIEKVLPWGGRISWAAGAALVGWGAVTLATAF